MQRCVACTRRGIAHVVYDMCHVYMHLGGGDGASTSFKITDSGDMNIKWNPLYIYRTCNHDARGDGIIVANFYQRNAEVPILLCV